MKSLLRVGAALVGLSAVAAYVAVGWVAGIVLFTFAVAAFVLSLARLARAYAPTLRCSSCDATVSVYGRFRCSACRAVTEGSAWRCPLCSAEYQFLPCPQCGVACVRPDRGTS